jgi:hypothetical protein
MGKSPIEILLEGAKQLEGSRNLYPQSFWGLPVFLNPSLPKDSIQVHVGENVYAELMKFPPGKET